MAGGQECPCRALLRGQLPIRVLLETCPFSGPVRPPVATGLHPARPPVHSQHIDRPIHQPAKVSDPFDVELLDA